MIYQYCWLTNSIEWTPSPFDSKEGLNGFGNWNLGILFIFQKTSKFELQRVLHSYVHYNELFGIILTPSCSTTLPSKRTILSKFRIFKYLTLSSCTNWVKARKGLSCFGHWKEKRLVSLQWGQIHVIHVMYIC